MSLSSHITNIQLWCSSNHTLYITSITYNYHTDIYFLINIKHIRIHIHIQTWNMQGSKGNLLSSVFIVDAVDIPQAAALTATAPGGTGGARRGSVYHLPEGAGKAAGSASASASPQGQGQGHGHARARGGIKDNAGKSILDIRKRDISLYCWCLIFMWSAALES